MSLQSVFLKYFFLLAYKGNFTYGSGVTEAGAELKCKLKQEEIRRTAILMLRTVFQVDLQMGKRLKYLRQYLGSSFNEPVNIFMGVCKRDVELGPHGVQKYAFLK